MATVSEGGKIFKAFCDAKVFFGSLPRGINGSHASVAARALARFGWFNARTGVEPQ